MKPTVDVLQNRHHSSDPIASGAEQNKFQTKKPNARKGKNKVSRNGIRE